MNLTGIYVGLLYAAAVFWARRAGVALPKRVALFFYALVLVFFFKPLTQDYLNFPIDVLKSIPPWAHLTKDHHQYTAELNDLPMQIVPWTHQVREAWKSFDVPLWNPMTGAGYPLHGNGQSSALSLLRFLTLPLSLPNAVTAEAAMKVLLALTFTFLYCRRRYSLLGSTIAAVSFGFGGFIIGWLHFPMVTAACLAPAILYCVDLLAEKRTFGRFVFAAAVWTQLNYAGHPETTAHLFWLAAVYTLWLIFAERVQSWRFVFPLAGVMIVAGMLSAPFLLPFLETMSRSKRVAELKAMPLDPNALSNTDRNSAIVMLQPHFFGQVPLEKAWGPADTEPLAGYTGVFAWAAWLAVALHVVWRRQWRSREMFFVLTTLFVLGVIYSWPVVAEAFHAMLPIAANARMRLIFTLLAAIQVAAAIDLAVGAETGALARFRRRTTGVPALLGILAVAATLFMLLRIVPMYYAYRYDTAVLAMLPSMLVLVVGAVVATTRREWAVMALLVAVTFELFMIGRDRPTPLPFRTLYPKTPVIAKLQELAAKEPPNSFRFTGIGAPLFPNVNVMYGLEDIRAHDPMSYANYLAFLKLTADYEVWNYFAFLTSENKPVYDHLNVKYLLLEPGWHVTDRKRFKFHYDGPDGRIVENTTVLPRFYPVRNVLLEFRKEVFYPALRHHKDWATTAWLDELTVENETQRSDFFAPRPDDVPIATATILSATATDYRLKTDAPRWSLIVSSIPWWPGWKVTRNGEAVKPIRVNGVFLGFAVPPGTTDVRVYYSPLSWWAGVAIAMLALIGICGSAVHARRRPPAPAEEQAPLVAFPQAG
ncbi:MAG TPA: YfhO family protein [Thermoanaerobaculia bacterium]|nr:YfhO family protein [Thermoanaerobaculia bacterium]